MAVAQYYIVYSGEQVLNTEGTNGTMHAMLFYMRRQLLRIAGYRLVSVVHYESYRDSALTEGIYRHPSGREKHIVVGRWLSRAQMR